MEREGCVGRCEGRRGATGEQRKGPRSVSCTEVTALSSQSCCSRSCCPTAPGRLRGSCCSLKSSIRNAPCTLLPTEQQPSTAPAGPRSVYSSPSPPAQPSPRRSRQEPSHSAPGTAELVLLHSAAAPTPPPPGTFSGSRRSPGKHQRSGSWAPPPLAPLRGGSRSATALSRHSPAPMG